MGLQRERLSVLKTVALVFLARYCGLRAGTVGCTGKGRLMGSTGRGSSCLVPLFGVSFAAHSPSRVSGGPRTIHPTSRFQEIIPATLKATNNC